MAAGTLFIYSVLFFARFLITFCDYILSTVGLKTTIYLLFFSFSFVYLFVDGVRVPACVQGPILYTRSHLIALHKPLGLRSQTPDVPRKAEEEEAGDKQGTNPSSRQALLEMFDLSPMRRASCRS